jgi:hypothetical protein
LYGQRSAVDTRGGGAWRISDSGGPPVQLTELKLGELIHIPTGFLPDGRRFLYAAYQVPVIQIGPGNETEIRIGSIDRKPGEQDSTTLMSADGPAVYAAPGYLLFVKRGSLMAQAFDAQRGALVGAPIQIASESRSNIAV